MKEYREITLQAIPENAGLLTEFIEGELEKAGVPFGVVAKIDVAIDEIFANIASYSYAPGTGDVTVRVGFQSGPAAVEITFLDSGVAFDPLAKPDPDVTLSAEERSVGGLGIFLVKKIMDETLYERVDGKNSLTIKKRLEE